MYYIVYGFLYLVSLLPFFILYRISDAFYVLIYYISGYRKKIVMYNLSIAFPHYTQKKRVRIAKDFYKGFIDTMIETIKLLSLSDREFSKRITGDFSKVNELIASGKNIQMLGAHQFNWEYGNLFFSKNITPPFVGVVANVENGILNRIFFKLRGRYGSVLIPNSNFQREMAEHMKKQYTLCLVADQNTNPSKAGWLNFFNKPVPFIMGPHRALVRYQPVAVYFNNYKLKRGYYQCEILNIIENIEDYTPEALALIYRDHLEKVIRKQPGSYLWSHRRWKHEYNNDYAKNWIDNEPLPN